MINKDILINNPQLLKKKNIKQDKIISNMEKEIRSLERKIDNVYLINKKNSVIKNLKIFSAVTKNVAPFVLACCITFGSFSILGYTPFGAEKMQKLNTMKEIDSLGNIRYEQQYKDKKEQNILIYYDKWQKDNSNYFKREIKTYNLNKLSEEKIIEIINSSKNLDLNNILGKPISVKTEINKNISEEELNSFGVMKALIYSENDDDYIIVKASIEENFFITFLYLIAFIIAELVVITVKDELCVKTLKEKCFEIKMAYPNIDVMELEKALFIKKDNYNKLVGKNYEKCKKK